MKKTLLVGLAGLLLLVACGQSGPLYLPESDDGGGETTESGIAE